MNYNLLLDATIELGYQLAINGAETFRVEESVNRIMLSYGIMAEVFAIPNCLHISIQTPDREPITRMRRISFHGTNLEAVGKYSNLSRKICSECPDPEIALQWIQETSSELRKYTPAFYLFGHFLGAGGFALLFGGSAVDGICAGICGIIIGLITMLMDNLKANLFFKTITASFIMALLAYVADYLGISGNVDTVIIGALMILVPGLLFTNAMRDIIYGDTNSGINRIVQVFLIAAAIALGTGVALTLADQFRGTQVSPEIINHPLFIELLVSFVGCLGFAIIFNIHGHGIALCVLGSSLTWLTYRIASGVGSDEIAAYFFAAAVASLYSEILARIRKYPAISYLVTAIFPLIPGAGVYYTMNYAVRGDMQNFSRQGIYTAAIAGIMAVGILLSSTVVRMISARLLNRK